MQLIRPSRLNGVGSRMAFRSQSNWRSVPTPHQPHFSQQTVHPYQTHQYSSQPNAALGCQTLSNPQSSSWRSNYNPQHPPNTKSTVNSATQSEWLQSPTEGLEQQEAEKTSHGTEALDAAP